jgi:hypothetical protein
MQNETFVPCTGLNTMPKVFVNVLAGLGAAKADLHTTTAIKRMICLTG